MKAKHSALLAIVGGFADLRRRLGVDGECSTDDADHSSPWGNYASNYDACWPVYVGGELLPACSWRNCLGDRCLYVLRENDDASPKFRKADGCLWRYHAGARRRHDWESVFDDAGVGDFGCCYACPWSSDALQRL